MRKAMRSPKTFMVDEDSISYLRRTQGNGSASERLNELLRSAIRREQEERLEREAAKFFGRPSRAQRAEAKAFQKAARTSWARD